MMHYACKKCGSKNVGIETKGTQIGLYCLDCGAWIKWCNKDEVRLFSNRQHNQDNAFSENIKKIAEHYGLDSQTHILIGKMAELTQAISMLYRVAGGYGYPTNKVLADKLYEEIADVEICIDEVKHLLECQRFIDKWKDAKIKEQLKRIGE